MSGEPNATGSGCRHMDSVKEEDEFRRIQLMTKVDRADQLIRSYQHNIGFYVSRLKNYYDIIGHVDERLGDPEPEELS